MSKFADAMTRRAGLALCCAVVVVGCAQLQGSPALRPHARAAAAVEADMSASGAVDADRADATADGSGSATETLSRTDRTEANVGDGAEASGRAVADVWSPPPSASFDRDAEPVIDRTPVGWFPPLVGLAPGAIIGRFGDPRDGGRRSHEGIDISAPRGTEVIAPVGGLVVASGVRGRAGNMVILLADDGVDELYFMHLDSRAVARGDRIRAGQIVGTVGNTGNAAGASPHLHFEVRRADRPVDPYPLLLQ